MTDSCAESALRLSRESVRVRTDRESVSCRPGMISRGVNNGGDWEGKGKSGIEELRVRLENHCRCVVCACSAGTVGSFSNNSTLFAKIRQIARAPERRATAPCPWTVAVPWTHPPAYMLQSINKIKSTPPCVTPRHSLLLRPGRTGRPPRNIAQL